MYVQNKAFLGQLTDDDPYLGLFTPSPTPTTSVPAMPDADEVGHETARQTGLDKFFESLPRLLASGLSVVQANRLSKINIQRAKQGLAPLDPAQMRALQPTAGVNVGISPDIKKMLTFGGLSLALILILLIMRRK